MLVRLRGLIDLQENKNWRNIKVMFDWQLTYLQFEDDNCTLFLLSIRKEISEILSGLKYFESFYDCLRGRVTNNSNHHIYQGVIV